jgi:hypothetical protein
MTPDEILLALVGLLGLALVAAGLRLVLAERQRWRRIDAELRETREYRENDQDETWEE